MAQQELVSIGERIRWIIEKHLGITQAEFAKWIEVEPPQLSRWVRDRNIPREDTLERIANEAGVSLLWLRHGDGNPLVITSADLERLRGHPLSNGNSAHAPEPENNLAQERAHLEDVLRRIGSPGTELSRKMDALQGYKQVLSTLGPVPDWWYDLRDLVQADII